MATPFREALPQESADDDAALLAAVRGSNERAFEVIFRRHYAGLCDCAERYLRAPDLAEEVVQEVLCSLWASRQTVVITGSLTAYLYTAARNKSLNRLRRADVEARYAAEVMPTLVADDAVDEAVDEAVVDRHAVLLDRAIAQLSSAQRELLFLRWRQQLSYAEIGALTGRSVKAVEVQLYRILKSLRDMVATM